MLVQVVRKMTLLHAQVKEFTLYASLLGIILKSLTGMYCHCKSYYNVNVMIMKE